MHKTIFIFAEYFRGLNQSDRLTGGTIMFYEAVSALAKLFDVRVFSFDPTPGCNNLGELTARTVHLEGPKERGFKLIAAWNRVLRLAYKQAVATYGIPAAIVAGSDTIPLLGFGETYGVKRIAVVQAYENFGLFGPNNSIADRINGLKRSLKTRLASKSAIRNADLIIVNSEYMRLIVQSHFNSTRTRVIYPPLSTIFNHPQAQSVDPPPFTVGFVTRNAGKNLPFVVSLADAMPKAAFKVFGPLTSVPPHPSNVEFMGWFPDRLEMFSRALVWLVPSKWPEPFGMVSIEAQAAGRSVLVSKRGGLPETVPTSNYVLSTFDRALWKQSIYEAFEHPQMADREFLQRFRPDRIACNWQAAITQLIGA
jgi:glycosyltransferase involved in cell wall biosynthesis